MYTLPVITDRHRKMLKLIDVERILNQHLPSALNGVLNPKIYRVIHWKENTVNQPVINHTYPFQPLKDIIQSKPKFYPLNGLALPECPRPHITKVSWLIALWEERNNFVPDYAPKTLSSGVDIELFEGSFVLCYKTVSRQIWSPSYHNPVTLNPLTVENFKEVLNFHLDRAFHDWLFVRELPSYRHFSDEINH